MSQLDANQKIKVLLGHTFWRPGCIAPGRADQPIGLPYGPMVRRKIINYENTVIVVSHDRHFLNKVCTHC